MYVFEPHPERERDPSGATASKRNRSGRSVPSGGGDPLRISVRAARGGDSSHGSSSLETSAMEQSLLPPGAGRPLDPEMRTRMASRLGHDFDDTRIHVGAEAAAMARALAARAYTVGTDIVFGPGEYAPGSPAGRRLLAHELAHVVQQSGDRRRGTLSTPGDRWERQADRVARDVGGGGRVSPLGSPPGVQAVPTHFSERYTTWSVVPHVERPGRERTYTLRFDLSVAMEINWLEDVDVGEVRELLRETLNRHAGGWREFDGQRVYVEWNLNWVDSSRVLAGDALGVSLFPGEAFEEVGRDGMFFHTGRGSRISLNGRLARRALRGGRGRRARSRRARRERRRRRRRFGHSVTHEIGHALGLEHAAGTVMSRANTERVDRHMTASQIRELVLRLTSTPANLPAWLRGEQR